MLAEEKTPVGLKVGKRTRLLRSSFLRGATEGSWEFGLILGVATVASARRFDMVAERC